jgi:hypothetical protein
VVYQLVSNGDVPDEDYFNLALMKQTVVKCTSGTRPSSPDEGMTVHETDTGIRRAYDGTDWRASAGYMPHVLVARTTTQSIPNNTMTTVSYSSALRNEFGMWSAGSPTLVTIPYDGLYAVVHTVLFASQAVAAGIRIARLDVGGVEQVYTVTPTTSGLNSTVITQQVSYQMVMTAGEQIEGKCFQTSGGALNISNGRMLVAMVCEI